MTRKVGLTMLLFLLLGLGASVSSAHAYFMEEGTLNPSAEAPSPPVQTDEEAPPAQQSTAQQPEETPPVIFYEVNNGDTLYQIAKGFNVSLEDLIAFNEIDNPNRLHVGQKLQIPAPSDTMPAVEGKQPVIHKVLSSTLTAYTAGRESTGKTPSHPQYGVTYSGAKAEEGRTIAVDPAVIPLGSTVYIEGIGLRKAEDTGSAIRGAKIDIFMEDVSEAMDFGVKKNVKVYVLNAA